MLLFIAGISPLVRCPRWILQGSHHRAFPGLEEILLQVFHALPTTRCSCLLAVRHRHHPPTTPVLSGTATYGQLARQSGYNYTAYGRISPKDLTAAVARNRRGKYRGYDFSHRYLRPRTHVQTTTRTWIATGYCALYATDFKKCVCPVFGDRIELLNYHDNTVWNGCASSTAAGHCENVTTLITAAWVEDLFPPDDVQVPLRRMFASWIGPKVCTRMYARVYARLCVLNSFLITIFSNQ